MTKAAKSEDTAIKKEEKKRATTDYEQRLAAVHTMKTMTDTPAFQAFYAGLKGRVTRHAELILIAEKPRDVIAHQEGVKVIREIMDGFAAPVNALNSYVAAMPLFAADFNVRAEWNEALGKIVLREVNR